MAETTLKSVRKRVIKKTVKRSAAGRPYVDGKGWYLDVVTCGPTYRLAWYSSSRFPCRRLRPRAEAPEDPSSDVQIADWAAAPYAQGSDTVGFFFSSEEQANRALSAVNKALSAIKQTRSQPAVDWERQARALGWKPPKGWKL